MPAIASRISKNPDICGGDACVDGHRIAVWLIVNLRRLGASDARIIEAYPTLTLADLDAAFEYAAAHPAEIEQRIAEDDADDGNDTPEW